MFAIEVRDHMMIAHSLPGEVFGPAQGLHGATFTVDAALFTEELDANGLVVDIGLATQLVKDVLEPLNYQNLDQLPQFEGAVTTSEYVAKYVFDRMAEAIAAGRLGDADQRLAKLRITLHESHVAKAWYEGAI